MPGGNEIPDGIWFGFAPDLLPTASSDTDGALVLDMGCFYSGAAAHAEAVWDGAYDISGIYVRNQAPRTFLTTVRQNATVYWLDTRIRYAETTFGEWPGGTGGRYLNCPSAGCAVWLYINGGRVTEIVEQYLP